MSDIYLSITETPTVVTLTNPLISSNVAQSVTVTNVVSVNVVTMPAINVTAAAPSVTTVAGTVAVSNFPSVTTVAGTVALDANSLSALENVTVTVGAAVSVSNFPSTQTIAGTVTANGDYIGIINDSSYPARGIAIGFIDANASGNFVAVDNDNPYRHFPVKIGGSLPEISGTVTANLVAFDVANEDRRPLQIADTGVGLIVAGSTNPNDYPVIVSGTVTVGNSVTIGSLPAISGTVTAAAPNGSLTTRFGTPTTANVSFATSAVTNANRKYLLIQNVTTGSNVITVGIGFTPTTTQGIQLTAGAGITFESSYIPTGQIFVLSSVTASNFTILEA